MNRLIMSLICLLAPVEAWAVTVWDCQAICGAITGDSAILKTGTGSGGSGQPKILSGGSATTALDAYNAASAACSAATNNRLAALGIATESGRVVLANIAQVCVKN